MSNVVDLQERRPKEATPDEILEASKGVFTKVIVIGVSDDFEMASFTSSNLTDAEAHFLLSRAAYLELVGATGDE